MLNEGGVGMPGGNRGMAAAMAVSTSTAAPSMSRLKSKVRVIWLFPWLSYATQAGIVAVLIAMAFVPGLASQLYTTMILLAFLLLAWFAVRRTSPRVAGSLPNR